MESAALVQPVDRVHNVFRPGAHSDVIRQVHPPDRACGVHEELGRTRDVSPILAALRVQNSILADDIRVRIGQEWETIAPGLAQFPRLSRRIHADSDNLDGAVVELAEMLLETP